MDIDYQKLLDESGLELIRKILIIVQKEGLYGEHHFYISFKTDDSDVVLSARMKSRYPTEITIVLQYQFENLIVDDDKFSVRISFDGIKETIVVPFRFITAFVDPSTKFSLQFKNVIDDKESTESKLPQHIQNINSVKHNSSDNVIQLDKFRKKIPNFNE